MLELSLSHARTLLLAAQGVLDPPARPAKEDLLDCIRRMAALQIDTIHVVNRSPYFVLWSRLGAYEPHWLDELLEDGALFEYWAHAASFLPIEDYPLYRRRMHDRGASWGAWRGSFPELTQRVLERIREEGALTSAQFEAAERRPGGWWNWKEERIVLEGLFNRGDLMIAKRRNFQRVYDLRERVLPAWQDSAMPSATEMRRQFALKSVRALGIAAAPWVADYLRIANRGVPALLEELAGEGALFPARIEGLTAPAYLHPDNAGLAEEVVIGRVKAERTTLLSPFDPVVWDRRRALGLFGFDYRIECYTPAPKRQYGYFTLPILHRNGIAGRLDPKAHRKDGVFEVKSLHLEPGVLVEGGLVQGLAEAIGNCAAWHKTPAVIIRETNPPALRQALTEAIASGPQR